MNTSFTLQNARVLFSDGSVQNEISVSNGVIVPDRQQTVRDLGGKSVIAGLVDMHTHGRYGLDFSTASVEELIRLRTVYAENGVTAVVPTLASDTFDGWMTAVCRIAQAGYTAVHLEGRYLSEKKRGVHRAELLCLPRIEELYALREAAPALHFHITVAPELPSSRAFIEEAVRLGYTVGIGHTDASAKIAADALSWGACSFTHLYNAMPPLHHRAGGPVSVALCSDAYTELICDGFHICPETVMLTQKIKHPDRVILVSDSMKATDCPDGTYQIAGETVSVRDGRALTADGVIGGSTLSLLCGVKNYMKFCAIPFADALRCATVNPARLLSMQAGELICGRRADFCVLDEAYRLCEVYVSGQKVK